MAQLGRIRWVEVDEKLMQGAFLVDPVPHYMMIMLLIHCYSEEFWSKFNERKRYIDLPKQQGTSTRIDACGRAISKNQGASYLHAQLDGKQTFRQCGFN